MNDLDSRRIDTLLTTRVVGRSLALLDRTGSTNDDARRAAQAWAPDGHVIVADMQEQGRGSRGRTWQSPAGTDLYLSVVKQLAVPPERLPPLTLAVGVALAEAVEVLLERTLEPRVKWPNDLWVGRRKVAGVLVETTSTGERQGPVVIGVGINVNRAAFPPDLDPPASSLALLAGRLFERARVLATFLNALEPWLTRFEQQGPTPVIAALNRRLALRGETASCDTRTGTVVGVAPSGALLLEDATGLHELTAGTLRPCAPPPPAQA